MKKVFAVIIALVLICAVALAEVDLSGMSFDELVELEKQVMMAIMQSDGWQEVEVPQGTYKVGEEIPAGKWTVTTNAWISQIWYSNNLSDDGTVDLMDCIDCVSVSQGEKASLTLLDGQYVSVEYGSMVFMPYTSNLGFK